MTIGIIILAAIFAVPSHCSLLETALYNDDFVTGARLAASLAFNVEGLQLAFFKALQFRRTSFARIFIEQGANLSSFNANESTPLEISVLASDVESVELLLEFGADPNQQNPSRCNRTALMSCIIELANSCNEFIAKTLYESSSNLKIEDCNGSSLSEIIQSSNLESVLINEKFENLQFDVDTPEGLFDSISQGNLGAIQKSLQSGVDPNFKLNSLTAVEFAAQGQFPKYLGSLRILLQNGAKLEPQILHHAVVTGSIPLVKMTLDHLQEVDYQTVCDMTPLMVCIWPNSGCNEFIAKLLLEKGANSELENCIGQNVKEIAAMNENPAFSQLLNDELKSAHFDPADLRFILSNDSEVLIEYSRQNSRVHNIVVQLNTPENVSNTFDVCDTKQMLLSQSGDIFSIVDSTVVWNDGDVVPYSFATFLDNGQVYSVSGRSWVYYEIQKPVPMVPIITKTGRTVEPTEETMATFSTTQVMTNETLTGTDGTTVAQQTGSTTPGSPSSSFETSLTSSTPAGTNETLTGTDRTTVAPQTDSTTPGSPGSSFETSSTSSTPGGTNETLTGTDGTTVAPQTDSTTPGSPGSSFETSSTGAQSTILHSSESSESPSESSTTPVVTDSTKVMTVDTNFSTFATGVRTNFSTFPPLVKPKFATFKFSGDYWQPTTLPPNRNGETPAEVGYEAILSYEGLANVTGRSNRSYSVKDSQVVSGYAGPPIEFELLFGNLSLDISHVKSSNFTLQITTNISAVVRNGSFVLTDSDILLELLEPKKYNDSHVCGQVDLATIDKMPWHRNIQAGPNNCSAVLISNKSLVTTYSCVQYHSDRLSLVEIGSKSEPKLANYFPKLDIAILELDHELNGTMPVCLPSRFQCEVDPIPERGCYVADLNGKPSKVQLRHGSHCSQDNSVICGQLSHLGEENVSEHASLICPLGDGYSQSRAVLMGWNQEKDYSNDQILFTQLCPILAHDQG